MGCFLPENPYVTLNSVTLCRCQASCSKNAQNSRLGTYSHGLEASCRRNVLLNNNHLIAARHCKHNTSSRRSIELPRRWIVGDRPHWLTVVCEGRQQTAIGKRIKQVAQVIDTMPEIKRSPSASPGATRTSFEQVRHGNLLRELADGLSVLDGFFARGGFSELTLVMVFSEFGERFGGNRQRRRGTGFDYRWRLICWLARRSSQPRTVGVGGRRHRCNA